MTNEEERADEKTALRENREMNAFDADDSRSPLTDAAGVRFTNGGEVTLDVDLMDRVEKNKKNEEFAGLKKDELKKFATDPYWVRLRIILLVFFGIVWVAMLVAAIVIIVVAPRCPPRPYQEWWETAVIYKLNTNSFYDTDGDGKGDIKGIHEQLPYLKDSLEVSALSLGPLYPSSNQNFGYDVTNHTSICGHYGTMDDFDSLRVAMHKKGMKLILDFIPNHTSRRHEWFNASRDVSRGDRFKDFYVWRQGSGANGTKEPPNGWLNVYGEPAWTYDEARGEFYYHSYTEDEPDLNLGNADVVQLLDEALLFWLKKHVDGFQFIGVERLCEPSNLDDNNTEVQPKTYELIAHWRELLDNYSTSSDLPKSRRFPRVLIVDVDQESNAIEQFSEFKGRPGAHLPTNKVLHSLNVTCDTNCVHSLLKGRSKFIEAHGKLSNWQVGSQEISRITTRMESRSYVNAINMLLLTLPGTPTIYNGDELGMKDAVFVEDRNYSIPKDLISRAGQRSPMQWSDRTNAGFTSGTPWLPLADDFHEVNVEAQTAHGSGMSPVKVFKSLVRLKAEPSFQWGQFNVTTDKSVLFYVRHAEGFPGYLVAINFGPQVSTVRFKDSAFKDLLPEEAEIVASTHNFEGSGRAENYNEKTTVQLGNMIYLKPTEGIVLKWLPTASYF